MRYLIISDIHGNFEALKAVLNKVPSYDEIIVLGDLVGYGASPNEVIRKIQELKPAGIVRGNHDKVCAGLEDGYNFNDNAYKSAKWTYNKMTKIALKFLKSIPQGPAEVNELITISHGSPMDEDYYILYEHDAYMSFQYFSTPICFFGHSHVPGVFVLESEKQNFYYFIPRGEFEIKIELNGKTRYLVNPGSIGQPRDYDPRASFCLLDTDSAVLCIYRIEYNIQKAASKIIKNKLPEFLAQRLLDGI